MALKSANPDLKVILSVGGWSHGTDKFSLAAQQANTFAQNALQFINDHNLDGIDIDWEYPSGADIDRYPLFIETIRAAFPTNLLVTAAVGAAPFRREASYPETERICNALDMIHLMTYDFHGGWETTIGHHSPWITDGNHPNDPNSRLTT